MYNCTSHADCVGKIAAYELSKMRWVSIITQLRSGGSLQRMRRIRAEYIKFWHDDDRVVRDTYRIMDDMYTCT